MAASGVPDSAWERLYVAAGYGLESSIILRLGKDTLALFTKTNLLTFAIILGAWAAAQFAGPVAWVADLGLAAFGLYALGQQIVSFSEEIGTYAKGAYQAQSEAQLREAGAHFANAM